MAYLQLKPNTNQYNPQSYNGNVNPSYPVQQDDKFRNPSNAARKVQPNRFVESQVNQVYKPIRSSEQEKSSLKPIVVVPAPTTAQVGMSNNQPTFLPVKSQLNRQASSKTHNSTGFTLTDNRYSNYLKQSEGSVYKYNIFSFLDEPWNNCLSGNKCGLCPSNECLPREAARQYWN